MQGGEGIMELLSQVLQQQGLSQGASAPAITPQMGGAGRTGTEGGQLSQSPSSDAAAATEGLMSLLGAMTSAQTNAMGAGGSMAGGGMGGGPLSSVGGISPGDIVGREGNLRGGELITRRGVTGVAPAIRSLMQAARATGDPVFGNMVSDFRSRAEQAALYQKYLSGQGNLAAPPGHSRHETGQAFDISTSFLQQNPDLVRWLYGHGWETPVGGEPWHWQYEPTNQEFRAARPQGGSGGAGRRRRAQSDNGFIPVMEYLNG